MHHFIILIVYKANYVLDSFTKTVARSSRKVAALVFSALGSSLGFPSLQGLRKEQGRGWLPRGRPWEGAAGAGQRGGTARATCSYLKGSCKGDKANSSSVVANDITRGHTPQRGRLASDFRKNFFTGNAAQVFPERLWNLHPWKLSRFMPRRWHSWLVLVTVPLWAADWTWWLPEVLPGNVAVSLWLNDFTVFTLDMIFVDLFLELMV